MSQGDVHEIVKLQHDVHILSSKNLIARISTTGFDTLILFLLSGICTRTIKRMIQQDMVNEVSKKIIAGSLKTGKAQLIMACQEKIVRRNPSEQKEMNGKGDWMKNEV